MKTLLIAFLLLPFACHADEWTDADTKIELTYMVFHLADWSQTKTISKSSGKYAEMNTVLGKHPSPAKVDAYFALSAIAHVSVSKYLPLEYRRAFQYVTIGMEAGTVSRNYRLGVGFSF